MPSTECKETYRRSSDNAGSDDGDADTRAASSGTSKQLQRKSACTLVVGLDFISTRSCVAGALVNAIAKVSVGPAAIFVLPCIEVLHKLGTGCASDVGGVVFANGVATSLHGRKLGWANFQVLGDGCQR